MKPTPRLWLIGYGVFLLAVGLLGYASNPEKAKTALISGGTFGALSIGFGLLVGRGMNWAYWAATATCVFLAAIFTWRSIATWQAYLADDASKQLAAILITAMLAGTLATIGFLLAKWKSWRAAPAG